MALTIERIERDGTCLLEVTGEVDLYSSPVLRKAVTKALPKDTGVLAVDLSAVPYMDSSGVATLVEGLRAAAGSNAAFVVVAPSKAVMKVLQLARLDMVFDVRERL